MSSPRISQFLANYLAHISGSLKGLPSGEFLGSDGPYGVDFCSGKTTIIHRRERSPYNGGEKVKEVSPTFLNRIQV